MQLDEWLEDRGAPVRRNPHARVGHVDEHARIMRSQRHLLSIINDILNFARLEAGYVEYRVTGVPVVDLLADLESLIKPQLVTKALHFSCDPVHGDVVARADAEKVRQVLLNLLANAVKFTSEGTVRLAARVVGDRVEFEVADSGPGIALEHLERVFDAFWQVDQRITRKTGGTGLGLSVARQLARLLGGDVSVRSVIGQGSVFTVDLPLVAPQPV